MPHSKIPPPRTQNPRSLRGGAFAHALESLVPAKGKSRFLARQKAGGLGMTTTRRGGTRKRRKTRATQSCGPPAAHEISLRASVASWPISPPLADNSYLPQPRWSDCAFCALSYVPADAPTEYVAAGFRETQIFP